MVCWCSAGAGFYEVFVLPTDHTSQSLVNMAPDNMLIRCCDMADSSSSSSSAVVLQVVCWCAPLSKQTRGSAPGSAPAGLLWFAPTAIASACQPLNHQIRPILIIFLKNRPCGAVLYKGLHCRPGPRCADKQSLIFHFNYLSYFKIK